MRAEPFVPVIESDGECRGCVSCNLNSNNCNFLLNYYNQLKCLDFNSIIQRFNRLGNFIKEKENFKENPIMILIVYETPDNPCSERIIIQKWFKENFYNLSEFNKSYFEKA